MRRIAICLALCLLVSSSIYAQLPPQGFIGLYSDEEHTDWCIYGTGVHTFYCFVQPPGAGLKCIELKTVLSSDNIFVVSPIFHPDHAEPVMGSVPGNLALCFNSCHSTGWVMAFSAQVIVVNTTLESITLEPFTGSPYMKILNCEGVEVEALHFPDIYINDPYCGYPHYYPPYLAYVTVQDESHIVATFTQGVAPYSAEQPDKYILFPKASPADTIPVATAEVVDYGEVLLTLEEPLIQGVMYTLIAENICSDLCATSQVDFMFSPVAALLQGFTAGYGQGGVELSWQLSEVYGDISFSVLRRMAMGGSFDELSYVEIERDGDTYTCFDTYAEPGESYVYRVDYVLGGETWVVLFETEAVQTPAAPLALHQNVPNPFNPVTDISYYLPASSDVLLEVYDVTGKRVATLERGRREKGPHIVMWQGVDDAGRSAASGIYFYRLRAGKEVVSKKMVLLR